MQTLEKLKLLEDMLELDEGSLNKDMELSQIEEWDSVAIISLIALIDEEFDKSITGKQIREFNTVADILAVMEK